MNATIAVPSGGSYFEGHFPGLPILPGVVELELILEALACDRPVALRGIVFARLRQLVQPGDLLELVARDLDNGHLRIDLSREGVLVANGELILGSPEQPPATASSVARTARPMSPVPPLDALVPHRPPMRFITSILEQTTDGLTCAGCVPATCALVSNGSAPALAGLEAAAQAAAAWEAVRRWREGGVAAPRIGYLVALRDVTFFAGRIAADQNLLTSVRLDAAAPPLTHYRVDVSQGGIPVVHGTIATFLKEEDRHDAPVQT